MNKRSPEYFSRELELADALEAYTAWLEGRTPDPGAWARLRRWMAEDAEFEALTRLVRAAHFARNAEGYLPTPERLEALRERVLDRFRREQSRRYLEAASPFPAGADSELLYADEGDALLELDMPRVAAPARPVDSPAFQSRSDAAWVRLEIQEDAQRREVDVRLFDAVLGRGAVPIRLEGDLQISRRHARLTLEEGRVIVTDLRSRNGTYLNGHRIERPTPLEIGDILELGQTPLSVEQILPEEPGYVRVLLVSERGEEYWIDLSEVVLGRSPDLAVPLEDSSRRLSRRHARMDLRDGAIYLTDLNSTNGTFHFQRRIRGPLELEVGTEIRLGGVILHVLHIAHEL